MLKKIAAELLVLPQLDALLESLGRNVRFQLICGFDDSTRSMLMAALHFKTKRPILIVASDAVRAGKIYEDMLSISGDDSVTFFPARELVYYHGKLSESADVSAQRIKTMQQVVEGKSRITVTTVAGLMTKMTPPKRWLEAAFELKIGVNVNVTQLLKKLVSAGYERAEMVEAQGQVSMRGGIVDLFPMGELLPYRIEFFGDTIESIRCFDLETQRSKNKVESIKIFPAKEVPVWEEERMLALTELEEELKLIDYQLKNKGRSSSVERIREKLVEHLKKMREEIYFPGIEQYLLYFYPRPASLADYYGDDGILFLDDPLRCEQAAEQIGNELKEAQSALLVQGELLSGQTDLTWDYKEIISGLSMPLVAFSLFSHSSDLHPYRRTISLSAKPVPHFLGQWDYFCEEINHWRNLSYRVVILTSSRERSTGIIDLLNEQGVSAAYSLGEPELLPRAVTLLHGVLESGFVIPEIKLAVLTEQEVLPQKKRKRRLKGKEGIRIGDYHELQVGDYVVHEQHGIGRYLGLRTLEVDKIHRDYLYIQYAGNDKLFIPVEQIDVVRKYIGAEGKKPKLYALGGNEWSRIKARVQASVQELAKELLSLYASRETEQGRKFSPDHDFQQEFEAAFSFEETPDQLQAVREIKEDMEKSRPMDRLLCGDVGYGKTEVALRAAFKAIMDGSQVAFLVPTTVLAQQHYRTFLERFEGFPVTVGALSRFQSASEQKALLQGLREGSIDLVVGTHRLLSQDVRFKDLGLLVIDEEQRFGVRHKERIKMMKQNVDVLTMTATPIPRTLHMSLAGVRDMSVIETPPENRYPIQTYVMEFSDGLIREAILREVTRGGQVYFVHNRVQSIDKWANHLNTLIPEVKIGVAHGQMAEEQLNDVMVDFLKGEYDVLLSTTIVEAGLDIPNVNTIIIHDADKFGLSQLYQLRGRVGRSSRIAYCYLTYQRDKVLTEIAEKRLQAIKEFTELGSGFKIALRDLEIRGAGNILGPEQHGSMMAVGFDLYVKLLDDAVRTYKDDVRQSRPEPKLEINVDAFLPAAYISDTRQKIVFYQKVAAVESLAHVEEAREELSDRFGPLPAPAENLLNVAQIKLLAGELGVLSLGEEKNELQIRFDPRDDVDGGVLLALSNKYRGRLTVGAGKQFILAFRQHDKDGRGKLIFLMELFAELKSLAKEKNYRV